MAATLGHFKPCLDYYHSHLTASNPLSLPWHQADFLRDKSDHAFPCLKPFPNAGPAEMEPGTKRWPEPKQLETNKQSA